MKIEVREANDEGDVVTAGTLNPKEVNYLVQFALNCLVAMGMEMDLKSEPEEVDKIRMKVMSGMTVN